MHIFDIKQMKVHDERSKNVFYKTEQFKMRVIELKPGGNMPDCEMKSHVVFIVMNGAADITVNGKTETVTEGKCLVSQPGSILSMTSENGVRIIGIQIES